jgi:hypothetical protein
MEPVTQPMMPGKKVGQSVPSSGERDDNGDGLGLSIGGI